LAPEVNDEANHRVSTSGFPSRTLRFAGAREGLGIRAEQSKHKTVRQKRRLCGKRLQIVAATGSAAVIV
jgi:hypothetical protein